MLQVENIKKIYGKKSTLKGVNLTVGPGEVYGLVGKNGAGKTTLMNIIAGIICPTDGQCMINGRQSGKMALEKGLIGYLPDLPSFYDYLSVKEYLRFLSKQDIDSLNEIDTITDRLGIDPSAKIKTLSRGNKQKLGIVSAIVGHPSLLLLDEPTSALDPIGRRDVMSLINELKKDGMSIILSTHILSDLELVCDRIGFLHGGIIAREIDMKQEKPNNCVLQFSIEDDCEICEETIRDALRDYSFERENKLVRIFIQQGKKDQRELLKILASFPYPICKIESVDSLNLNSIMEEVLSL